MRFLIVLSAVLLAGCTDAGTGTDLEALEVQDEQNRAESWDWSYDGRLTGAGYCDGLGGRFAGISAFPEEFSVPAGTVSLAVRLTWGMPVPVCIYLTDPDGDWSVIESDPAQQLAQSMEVEPAAVSGTWSVWVAAKGATDMRFTLRVEGS